MKNIKHSIVAFISLVLVVSAWAADEVTTPFNGVTRIHRTLTSPRPLNINIIRVDLNAEGVGFTVTPSNGGASGDADPMVCTDFLTQTDAQIAINCGFYNMSSYDVLGFVSSNGDVYSDFVDYNQWEYWPTPFVALNLSRENVPTIITPGDTMPTYKTNPDMNPWNAVPGSEWIVRDGVAVVDNGFAVNPGLNPRTVGGYTQDLSELVLVTIDGRQDGFSEGMTTLEAAELLVSLGVYQGMNFDGGGSTTMAFADPSPRVVNSPSGGTQRSVANHLAIYTNGVPEVLDAPVAIKHLPFENDFAGAELIDDESGVQGDIQLVSGGKVGGCSQWTNPTGQSQGDNLRYDSGVLEQGTIAMYVNVPQAYNYMNFWDCGAVFWNWEAYCDSTGHVTNKTGGYPAAQFDMGSSADAPLGDWYHYAWTWDKASGAQKVYINGLLVTNVTNTNWVAPGGQFNVGGGTGNWKFNGLMDEFYVFDKPLTGSQIENLINTSESGKVASNPYPYVGDVVINNQITLSWDAPSNIVSPVYDVYLSDTEAFDPSDKITSGISTSTFDVNLTTNQDCYWKVVAFDGAESYESVVWTFNADIVEQKPVAVAYVPFEDSKFDGVTYIDDQDGVAGSIDIVSEGGVANMGSYGDWNNPTTATDGDSLYAAHPGLSGTIAMWVKYDYAALEVYAVMWDSSVSGNDWKTWAYIDNNMNARLNGVAWQANSGSASDFTQWNHVAWTWDSDGSTADTALFINGVEVNRRSQDWDDHADVMRIGGGGAWYPKFAGGMDEAYIFDMALTSDEIAAMVTDGDKIARNPYPAVSSVSAPINGVLGWDAPAGIANPTYNIYLSTNSTLHESFVGSTTSESFDASALIDADAKYYWRVDVVDGETTYAGYFWNFTAGYSDADINNNGIVALDDYSVLARNWQSNEAPCEGDIDGDCYVGIDDLQLLVEDWLNN